MIGKNIIGFKIFSKTFYQEISIAIAQVLMFITAIAMQAHNLPYR